MPLPAVRLGQPESPESFREFEIEGIRVFASSSLVREGPVRLVLRGWGPFRYLEATGIKVF